MLIQMLPRQYGGSCSVLRLLYSGEDLASERRPYGVLYNIQLFIVFKKHTTAAQGH